MINFNNSYRASAFESTPLEVHFVILHYTAQNLKKTLDIFLNSKNQVSSHLIIDQDGSLYELVNCMKSPCLKAFHAGKSFWKDKSGKTWENFNNYSIGIELINLNGNFFPYTDKQYSTLIKAIKHLQNIYPHLKNPEKILGHEHIAGYRGKKDPGYLMNWNKIYKEVYNASSPLSLKPILTSNQYKVGTFIIPKNLNQSLAKKISLILEKQTIFFIQLLLIIWTVLTSSNKKER